MPNDAKLGLLAGVLGVIVAATISGQPLQQTAQQTPISPQSAIVSQSPGKPTAAMAGDVRGTLTITPAPLSGDLSTAPLARVKNDVATTTTSRRLTHDDEEY